jgi:hypothetical protein|tara:strand:- start:26 stop:238 length:213 start_codon:yes stop_codon:yes gene_type:complete
MASTRTKKGLERVFVVLGSQQIGLWERYEITYEDRVVDNVKIDRYLNKGDDISGEESVVQIIANAYWNSL